MDVDSVDYSKFPGIEQLEYYSVSLNAGDCLYIPFRWYFFKILRQNRIVQSLN